jgi:microcystin-dependent protein
MTAASFCPSGYLEALGQLLPISGNEVLYSIIGTLYGGDGYTSFAVPDLRAREPVGGWIQGSNIGSTLAAIPTGARRGAESVRLTASQIATHSHYADFTGTMSPLAIQVTLQAVGPSTPPASSKVPSDATPYLAANPAGGASAKRMWAAAIAEPSVSVNGMDLTVSSKSAAEGGATVFNASTGEQNPAPIPTIPPQLVLRGCVAVQGTVPH